MDQREASQDLQQKHWLSCQSQDIPQEPEGTELRSSTGRRQEQPSHLQQEQQHQEQNAESPINQKQQENQESCSLPHIQQHLNSEVQEIQELQKHQSHEQQILESKELQMQLNHQPKIHQNQEPQYQGNQKPQTHESQELQTKQNQESQTHSSQILQSQQISIPVQATQSLSAPEQWQEKQSTQHQKQAKNHQHIEKRSQQWHQEQQLKKRKKKLVGENQERINYLVQASKAIALTPGSSNAVHSQRTLAAQLGSLAGAVGRRCVLRLAPALKRCLCKGCGTALVYGVNAKVRHRSRRQKHLVVTCLTCYTIKRFLNNPRHQLWFEQEEAVV